MLAALLSRPGEVVTRRELAEQVWGSETFVDFEQGLNFAIRHIRTVLGDDAEQPRFLETVPKRGYRFIATLESPAESAPAAMQPSAAVSPATLAAAEKPRSRTWMWVAVVSAVVLIAALSRYTFFKSKADREHAGPIESIAVLPLVNLSSDPAQEYFSDGLTDELITELAKIGTLRVISHTSADSYKGTGKRIPAIASELHVDAIVEGTIERAGDKVRIRAQLVSGAADQHLWAESYDGDVGNLLKLESEVARDIAKQIGYVTAQQSSEGGKKLVIPASAHEDYLRGRYYWNKRTEAGLRKGIEYFQKAIEQEPNYAHAYAGLADSYIMLANWGFAAPGDSYPKAKAAAQQALELNPQLAEAQTSLAYVTLLYEWNWTEAERRFRQAIAINPNYASAHQFYSICLMTAGRQPEALEEIHRAQRLDPLSLIVSDVLGWIYYEGRQFDQAVAQYKKTLEMDPGYVPALLDLGTSYLRTGDYDKAIEQFEKAKSLQGSNGVVLSGLAQAYALSGKRMDALTILKQLNEPSKSSFISAWDLSLVYAALGEKKKAIEMLGKAADDHVGWVVRLGIDPAFDSLRDDPEFQKLKQRVGVPGAG